MNSKMFKHAYFPSSLVFGKVLALSLFNWFAALFLIDLGMTGLEIGVLLSVFLVTSLFTTLPFGYLSDRFQLKRMVSFSVLCLMLFFLGLSFFTSFSMLLPFFFIGGVGANLFRTSARSFIFKSLDKHHEGFEISVLKFGASLANGIGGVLGGFLLLSMTFDNIFIISLVILSIVFIASFFLDKNVVHKPKVREYKKDASSKIVVILALVFFLYSFHSGSDNIAAPIVFRDVIGMTMFEIGIALGGVLFFVALVSLYLGKEFDKFHHFSKYVLFSGLFLSGVGHLLLATATTSWQAILYRLIHAVGDIGVDLFLLTEIAQLFTKKRIGGDYSMFLFVSVIAAAIGKLVIGALGEVVGYQPAFVLTGSLILLGAFIVLATHEHF